MACQQTDDNQQQGAKCSQQIGLQTNVGKEASTKENQEVQIGPRANFVVVSIE